MVRKISRFTARHAGLIIVAILGLCVFGFLPPLFTPEPARADAKVDALRKVALSDVAVNERLKAVDRLKKDGSSAATDALEAIAKGGDTRVATAACAQLGRLKSTTSKGKLKTVLEDTSAPTHARMAAAACIAEHWKDSGDISYLESKCSGNTALSSFVGVLKRDVYKVQ